VSKTARSTSLPELIPALGSASGGLRFELVLPKEENLEERDDPFVSLSDSGRFSRVLLARIAMGEDTTIRFLALKVQRSSYRPFGAGAGTTLGGNDAVNELWARERENLLTAESPELVKLLDMGPELARSKPVTFCKKVKKYFHPLCPKCAAYLEDCRDDTLLREFGLPTYSGSLARYLYCPDCSTAQEAIFYTYSVAAEEHPKGNVEIRRRSALYRDGAGLVNGEHPEEVRRRLERVFPCAGCAHRAECYPADSSGAVPAERLLVPLSYYEFASLPLELLQLHYDEFVDLLGGADWGEVRRNAEAMAPARVAALEALSAAFSSPFQWVYRYDTAGLFSIEVLRLKLIAFTQLCRGLHTLHAKSRQPHLNLNPLCAMAVVPAPNPDLPSRWNFQVKVLDPASPYRFQPLATLPEVAGDVFIPSPDVEKTYTSPIIRQEQLGSEETVRVTIRSMTAQGGGMRLAVDVVSPRKRLPDYKPRDLVRIVASSPIQWLEGVDLWGTLLEPLDGGYRVSAYLSQSREGAKVPVTFDGRISFYRRYSIPCDLYSLGMLLFRTLLVNDVRDMFTVEEAINRVMNKLLVGLEGAIQPDFRYIAGMLHFQIEAEKQVFDPKSVLYLTADRNAKENGIPTLLWSDLLLCAFRLISNIPGFSFCAHHGDYNPDKPEATLDEVLSTLEVLNTRLQIELFGALDRDREIAAACDDVIAEITKDGLGGDGEGEAGADEARFNVDRPS